MPLTAGKLRHWIDIEAPDDAQDSDGERVRAWSLVVRVPASIEPLSARELIAAQAVQSKVTARIVIRYRAGLSAAMRVNHAGTIYNIEGVLPDTNSLREYLTLPVSQGVNDGG